MSETELPPFEIEEVLDIYNRDTVNQTIGWGLIQSRVPDAWLHSEGEGIKIMVIDTGKPEHEDISPYYQENKNENFIVKTYSIKNDLDKNFVDGENIYDQNGHHTHCAGIICARNNQKGMVGVAPKSEIISVKALDKNGRGSSSNLLKSLEYALEIKPDIVSMSLGSSRSDPRIKKVIKELYNANIPVVCAAGNSGSLGVNFPAAYEETISVGAYDKNGKIAGFSSKGPEVDWAAPGVSIYSTFINNSYAKLNGTSMACPFIAGVIALMLAKHRKMESMGRYNNCKTVEEIKSHLLRCTNDKGSIGKDDSWGFGVIDINKLFEEPSAKPKPKPDPKPEPKPDPKPEPKPEPKPDPKPEPKPEADKQNWLKKNLAWVVCGSFILIAIIFYLTSLIKSTEDIYVPYIDKEGNVDWDKKYQNEKK